MRRSRYGARIEEVVNANFDGRSLEIVGGHEEKGKVRSNSPCLAGARGWVVDKTGPIKKAEQLVFCGPGSNFILSQAGGLVLPKAATLHLH
jgi:hypothetical protein